VSALPAFCFYTLISSVSALTMNTFTAIFLDLLSHDELLGVLVLDDDDAGVECRRRQRSASTR
jgi:hypothetical protein